MVFGAVFNRLDDEPGTTQRHSKNPPASPLRKGGKRRHADNFSPPCEGGEGGVVRSGMCNAKKKRAKGGVVQEQGGSSSPASSDIRWSQAVSPVPPRLPGELTLRFEAPHAGPGAGARRLHARGGRPADGGSGGLSRRGLRRRADGPP